MQRVAEERLIGRAALINTGNEAEVPTSTKSTSRRSPSYAPLTVMPITGPAIMLVHRALVLVPNNRARDRHFPSNRKLRHDVVSCHGSETANYPAAWASTSTRTFGPGPSVR